MFSILSNSRVKFIQQTSAHLHHLSSQLAASPDPQQWSPCTLWSDLTFGMPGINYVRTWWRVWLCNKPGWCWQWSCFASCRCRWWWACGWGLGCSLSVTHIHTWSTRSCSSPPADELLADQLPATDSWASWRWRIAKNISHQNQPKNISN